MTELAENDEAPAYEQDTAREHIRGSSLLLVGRFLALALGVVTDVLLVRYLSKSDYGIFAWALSIASLGATVALVGLDKAIGRFVPIFQEEHDRDRVAGVIVMMVLTVIVVGVALVVALLVLAGPLGSTISDDPVALATLLVVSALIPIRALDSLQVAMLAIFASPFAIFFRRFVLAPGFELAVVALLVILGGNLAFVAVGYVIAALAGVLLYGAILAGILIRDGVFANVHLARLRMPSREIFSFAIPLLSSDFVFLLRGSLLVILLEALRGATDVAEFRAVLPIARNNMIVLQTFTFLFTPMASRLFARRDREGMSELYWRSAAWIAVVTFPIFAVSFSLAEPVTVLLFGERYEDSWPILAIIAAGYYFNVALGFNGLVLRIVGAVRYVVMVDILTLAISIPLSIWLVIEFGALGAGVSLATILVIQNLLYHVALPRLAGVGVFDVRYARTYVLIAAAAALLAALQLLVDPPFVIALPLVGVTSLLVIYLSREVLQVGDTFPEIRRLPLAGRLFGG